MIHKIKLENWRSHEDTEAPLGTYGSRQARELPPLPEVLE